MSYNIKTKKSMLQGGGGGLQRKRRLSENSPRPSGSYSAGCLDDFF